MERFLKHEALNIRLNVIVRASRLFANSQQRTASSLTATSAGDTNA